MLEKKHTVMWKFSDDDKINAQIEALNNNIEEVVDSSYTSYAEKDNIEKLKTTKTEDHVKKMSLLL